MLQLPTLLRTGQMKEMWGFQPDIFSDEAISLWEGTLMMKIKRLRNGWIRAKGTLDLITGDLEVRIQGPEETWRKLPTPLGKTSSIPKRLLRNIFFRDVIIPVHNFLQPRRRGLSYKK